MYVRELYLILNLVFFCDCRVLCGQKALERTVSRRPGQEAAAVSRGVVVLFFVADSRLSDRRVQQQPAAGQLRC